MEIKVNHIDRTCLNKEAFLKLIKKYTKNLKYDVLISFDLRIKDYGSYIFDTAHARHLIRISPIECSFAKDKVKLEEAAEKYNLISTFLHEKHHAFQYETMGYQFWSKKYSCTVEIESPSATEYFSECEVSAREFENKHVIKAVKYYNSCVPEVPVL
jgi:hypothetical protein